MDDALLIEQVEKFRHIYDKQSSLFKNKLARENAWKTIGHILETKAGQCEQRWNVLRNKYAALKRQCKNTPSGSQAFTISWPYFECMQFLDPYMLSRVKRISSIRENPNSQSEQWPGSIRENPNSQSEQWPAMPDILNSDDLDGSLIEIIDEEIENIAPNSPHLDTANKRKNDFSQDKSAKKNKNSSDAMAEKMSVAFTSLSDSLSTYVAKKHMPRNEANSSDKAFADSIAGDLSRVENVADKMFIKQQIYSLLYEYFKRVERGVERDGVR